jgi:hypothetical protein
LCVVDLHCHLKHLRWVVSIFVKNNTSSYLSLPNEKEALDITINRLIYILANLSQNIRNQYSLLDHNGLKLFLNLRVSDVIHTDSDNILNVKPSILCLAVVNEAAGQFGWKLKAKRGLV